MDLKASGVLLHIFMILNDNESQDPFSGCSAALSLHFQAVILLTELTKLSC